MVCYCLYQANTGIHQPQNCLKLAPIHTLVHNYFFAQAQPEGCHLFIIPTEVVANWRGVILPDARGREGWGRSRNQSERSKSKTRRSVSTRRFISLPCKSKNGVRGQVRLSLLQPLQSGQEVDQDVPQHLDDRGHGHGRSHHEEVPRHCTSKNP